MQRSKVLDVRWETMWGRAPVVSVLRRGWMSGVLRLVFWVALASGLSCQRRTAERATSRPRVETMNAAEIAVTFTIDPPKIELHRDVFLTLEISSPTEVEIKLPDFGGRVQGFVVNGMFDEEPRVREGRKTVVRRARLTPLIASEYRIAPMPIEYEDRGRSPAQKGWFATRPIRLDLATPSVVPKGDIEVDLKPVRIRPPGRILVTYVATALGTIALLYLVVRLVRWCFEKRRMARASPRELALRELARLMAKNLVARQKIKEFYLELTMIVRRYIERAHGLRAPEQTTEEFLQAAAQDARFSPATLRKLGDFLEAADLVKFAAFRPDPATIDRAVSTAREYIETDRPASEEKPSREQRAPPGGR